MVLDREKISLIIISFVVGLLIFQIFLLLKPLALFQKARNITRLNHLKVIADIVSFYFVQKGKFPDCLPEAGQPIAVNQCLELREYFSNQFPQDPDPKANYLMEYLDNKKDHIRVYSSAAEAKGIEIIR